MSRVTKPNPPSAKRNSRLQNRLNSLVASGELSLANGLQLRVEDNGLPSLVQDQLPTISKSRLTIIWARVGFHSSFDLKGAFKELRRLGNSSDIPTCTHQDVWDIISSAHEKVIEDHEAIVSLYYQLNRNPERVKDLQIRGDLPQRVCRFVGQAAERAYDDNRGEHWNSELSRSHHGLGTLVHEILNCVRDAKAHPGDAYLLGVRARDCLDTLLDAKDIKKPLTLLDNDPFLSLKYRVDEIARGNRETSPT
ncbi:hypothetical protein FDECE_404 [Fusarium decemcellulare]|nr:hypothetical protein FDECE_404 [Fusarium decemcellulare]